MSKEGDYQCLNCGRDYNRIEDLENGFETPANCICEEDA